MVMCFTYLPITKINCTLYTVNLTVREDETTRKHLRKMIASAEASLQQNLEVLISVLCFSGAATEPTRTQGAAGGISDDADGWVECRCCDD